MTLILLMATSLLVAVVTITACKIPPLQGTVIDPIKRVYVNNNTETVSAAPARLIAAIPRKISLSKALRRSNITKNASKTVLGSKVVSLSMAQKAATFPKGAVRLIG
jgi:hypothetical protein